MVLRGRADHRGATDVDVLDHFIVFSTFGDCFFERVQIDDYQIDCADPVLVHRRDMFVIVAQSQQTAMHHRVQGLDPTVHHFGKSCNLGYVLYGQPGVAQCFGGAAGA